MVNDEVVFNIEGGTVSDGSTEQLTESDNESWMIKKIQVIETSGTDLTASTATISIMGDSVTDQNINISSLQENYRDLPELDLEWPQQKDFEFDWTNSSGGDATIMVQLWVEPMNGGPS